MNSHHNQLPASGSEQSPLSLLVNAADSHDPPRGQREGGGQMPGRSLADALRLRGLTGDAGSSLEEQLLLQQPQGAFGNPAAHALLSQIRDQNVLSQIGQQQQLAALLGLGGVNNSAGNDMRSALAAAQLRQQQQQNQQNQASQLNHADILALSRSGALSGLQGLLGGVGGVGAGSGGSNPGNRIVSEMDGLQRLEELDRRQRLMSASAPTASLPSMGSRQMESSTAARQASASNNEEPAEPRIPRQPEASTNSKPKPPTSSSPVVPAAATPSTEVAAAPAPESGKEELEKAPGSVIVPCRARGMPMDHNFKTAYFVIPENVKHGEELICSYFACRNAGIKFRYCSHCKVPVAKRNFRKRHKHGGEEIAKIPGEDSGGEEDLPVKTGIPSQITANREEIVEADGISSQSADSTNQQEKNITDADVNKGLVRSSMRTFETSKKTKTYASAGMQPSHSSDGKITDERQQRWLSLLGNRPATKDGDSMSAWLMEVLAVSDLETPLKPSDDVAQVPNQSRNRIESKDNRKKHYDHAENESPRSDIGYGSSNDDSGANDKKEHDRKPSTSPFNSGIVKKKRAADLLDDIDKSNPPTDSFVSGSFAAWKERKRQKKQSKVGSLSKDQA